VDSDIKQILIKLTIYSELFYFWSLLPKKEIRSKTENIIDNVIIDLLN